MPTPLLQLRALRDIVEAEVFDQRVDACLGPGVHRYVAALVRLVEDGDRDPSIALNEGLSAAGFLRVVPRLPPVRARQWSPQCPA
ncbi:hypothetical protein FV226_12275 [Methylobacterium sp. WL12]|uniref:hypothetical protein n=1 Tax=Methylobacterium sp. WL12 TaxID=2603890 RepID=UPI0011C83237|nr:hypothetical protein [Methylobacterium sp. WL12]TXM72456.1 hypothetical protein FV226_12275 [Methylobacterium sp. WL12]